MKTLNDLTKENIEIYGINSLFWKQEQSEEKAFVFPERIRKDAISDVKDMKKENDLLIKEFDFKNYSDFLNRIKRNIAKIEYIMEKNNLTGDDLE